MDPESGISGRCADVEQPSYSSLTIFIPGFTNISMNAHPTGATILVVEIPFELWSDFTISIEINKHRPRPRHADTVPSIGLSVLHPLPQKIQQGLVNEHNDTPNVSDSEIFETQSRNAASAQEPPRRGNYNTRKLHPRELR